MDSIEKVQSAINLYKGNAKDFARLVKSGSLSYEEMNRLKNILNDDFHKIRKRVKNLYAEDPVPSEILLDDGKLLIQKKEKPTNYIFPK